MEDRRQARGNALVVRVSLKGNQCRRGVGSTSKRTLDQKLSFDWGEKQAPGLAVPHQVPPLPPCVAISLQGPPEGLLRPSL